MDSLWLVKVTFAHSNQVYTYYANDVLNKGDQAVVLAPNGEYKVVRVVGVKKATKREINGHDFFVKPIFGIVVPFAETNTEHTPPNPFKNRKKEDDSPV